MKPGNTSGIARGHKNTVICRLCTRTSPDHSFANLRAGICRFCMDGHSGGRGSQTQVFQAPSSIAPSKTNAGDREGSSRIYNGRDF